MGLFSYHRPPFFATVQNHLLPSPTHEVLHLSSASESVRGSECVCPFIVLGVKVS
jgi:hypothetical protein